MKKGVVVLLHFKILLQIDLSIGVDTRKMLHVSHEGRMFLFDHIKHTTRNFQLIMKPSKFNTNVAVWPTYTNKKSSIRLALSVKLFLLDATTLNSENLNNHFF